MVTHFQSVMVHRPLIKLLNPLRLTDLDLCITVVAILWLNHLAGTGVVGEEVEFAFPDFKQSDAIHFNFSALTSGIQNGALQVTFDSGSLSTAIMNTSGQITYAMELELWRASYDYTASFNTSFMINMGPTQGGGSNETGGGMAFYLSSLPPAHIENSYGLYLGLLNSSYAPAFVAIEFDTFKDTPSDPDNNHLGIDINSTENSIWTGSLTTFNVTLDDFAAGSNTSVWIDYDGNTRKLDVYLANQGSVQSANKPDRPFLSQYSIDLRKHLPQSVFVGFSASTGAYKEAHCVINWNFTSTSFPTDTGTSRDLIRTLTIGLSLGFLALVVISAFVIWLAILKMRQLRSKLLLQGLIAFDVGPHKFAYKDLKKATSGFSDGKKLGQGAQGTVYRGRLILDRSNTEPQVSMEVAVKVLLERSKRGEREFRAEIESIGRMRHKNLVQLLGWSYHDRKGTLLLVYEYMPNQSLDKWLHAADRDRLLQSPSPEDTPEDDTQNTPTLQGNILDWAGRYNVLIGVASGLVYLHEEWEMVVVHRDLKPSNIMLDKEFNAKLGDFGLARLIKNQSCYGDQEGAQTITIAGTPGYMAPECIETGAITKESDVYSFGAVAMEVVTGRRLSFENLHRLWSLHEDKRLIEAVADDLISGADSFNKKQMELVLKLSMACCHPQPTSRPSMRQIHHALSSLSPPPSSDPSISAAAAAFIDPDFQLSQSLPFLSASPLSLSSITTTLPFSTTNPSIPAN